MKGNETRVVFFLHPVDQLKDGQVSKMKPLRSAFGVLSLLLGLLLGLGVLVFLLFPLGVQTSQQSLVSNGTTQQEYNEYVEYDYDAKDLNFTRIERIFQELQEFYKNNLNDLYELNDTNTESAVKERTTEVTRENYSTAEPEALNETTSPGMFTSILCNEST